MLFTGTRGHTQLGLGSTVLADGGTALGSADRRDQQTNCEVQSSASELGEIRQGRLQNDLQQQHTATATYSGREVEENPSIFISSETSEASSDRGTPGCRSTFKTGECMFSQVAENIFKELLPTSWMSKNALGD